MPRIVFYHHNQAFDIILKNISKSIRILYLGCHLYDGSTSKYVLNLIKFSFLYVNNRLFTQIHKQNFSSTVI